MKGGPKSSLRPFLHRALQLRAQPGGGGRKVLSVVRGYGCWTYFLGVEICYLVIFRG